MFDFEKFSQSVFLAECTNPGGDQNIFSPEFSSATSSTFDSYIKLPHEINRCFYTTSSGLTALNIKICQD